LLVPIAGPDDERVADYVRLTDPDLRRLREASDGADGGFFIAEGVQVIRTLLASTYRVRSLFVTPRRWEALAPCGVPDEVPVYVADQAVLNEVAGFPLHRGALASAERPAPAPLA
jgi:tRNA G18 (ribose-2'-O)-methylase SpoU